MIWIQTVMVVCDIELQWKATLTFLVVTNIIKWPKYSRNPSNFVFRSDQSYVEVDTDRKEGVEYINSLVR